MTRAAATLRQCARDVAVDLQAVDHGGPTLRKTRVVGQQQQIVRLDYEEIRRSDPATETRILNRFDASADDCDIVIISDYAKGFLSTSLAEVHHPSGVTERGRQVVVDPRPQHREYLRGLRLL